jgi:hypothetical protein
MEGAIKDGCAARAWGARVVEAAARACRSQFEVNTQDQRCARRGAQEARRTSRKVRRSLSSRPCKRYTSGTLHMRREKEREKARERKSRKKRPWLALCTYARAHASSQHAHDTHKRASDAERPLASPCALLIESQRRASLKVRGQHARQNADAQARRTSWKGRSAVWRGSHA